MKRNKTNNRVARSGKSPYAKYGKVPYKYDLESAESVRLRLNLKHGKFASLYASLGEV